jgi:hypothetical protein
VRGREESAAGRVRSTASASSQSVCPKSTRVVLDRIHPELSARCAVGRNRPRAYTGFGHDAGRWTRSPRSTPDHPLPRVGGRGRHRGVLFDRIDHAALLGRVRERIVDKRALRLLKAFLHGGILTGHGGFERSPAPRKAESPLLASIALPAPDGLRPRLAGMGANSGQRQARRRRCEATYPLGSCAAPARLPLGDAAHRRSRPRSRSGTTSRRTRARNPSRCRSCIRGNAAATC